MLLPALQQARERGKSITCVNNIRQVGGATIRYSDDFNNYILPSDMGHMGSTIETGWKWSENNKNAYYWILNQLSYVPQFFEKGKTEISGKGGIFFCPTLPKEKTLNTLMYYSSIDYGISSSASFNNPNSGSPKVMIHKLNKIKTPSIKYYMTDTIKFGGTGYYYINITRKDIRTDEGIPDGRHLNATNMFYLDGHVSPVIRQSFESYSPLYPAGATKIPDENIAYIK